MRLIDRLDLPRVPVIVADNIAVAIDALDTTGKDTPQAAAYGCVAPPFEQFFVEAITRIGARVVERGAYFDVDEGEPGDPVRWRYRVQGYQFVNDLLMTANGVAVVELDHDGYILTDTAKVAVEVRQVPQDGKALRHPRRGTETIGVMFLPVALKAISALHKRATAEHVKPTRQQRRRHKRKTGRDLRDYYVLRVRPAGDTAFENIGEPQQRRGKRRAHVVRGHFRYYSPEAPMFGRASGAVWIPEHERGDSALGAIRKDYEVGE